MSKKDIRVFVPMSLEQDNPTKDDIVRALTEQKERYGIKHFYLNAPAPSWRGKHYPPREAFIKAAELFRDVRDELRPLGIHCSWWVGATLKSGPSEKFIRMVRFNGDVAPFANCPLDPEFKKTFSENVALFAKIAHPETIVTEDDYSIHAAAFKYGCFCKFHLAEFAKREGREYTREELVEKFMRGDKEDIALLYRWRALMCDSLVGLGEAAREALDRETPEIPMGYMQSGSADHDGNCTEAVARAFAGKRHTPFSRVAGAFYNGVEKKHIPEALFHTLYTKQHVSDPFTFYHESDTFPHTRFFTTGGDMRTLMGAVYSYGFVGSTFQTQQILDDPNEEHAYGDMFREERKRFATVSDIANKCRTVGAKITYCPFFNTLPPETTKLPECKREPWAQVLGRISLPYTTVDSDIVFLDAVGAKYYSEEKLKELLSRFVFLDGEAAAQLTARGLDKYIGVSVEAKEVVEAPLVFDLGARDVLRPEFRTEGKGKHIPATHMFSNGGCGALYRLYDVKEDTEIITELHNSDGVCIAPTMTVAKNSLGGRVLVMGMTVAKNNSQALYNYRRMRLWQQLIEKYCDKLAFPRDTAHVYVIMNEAKDKTEKLHGMLTLINLADDTQKNTAIHLPPEWRKCESIKYVTKSGTLRTAPVERSDDGITLSLPLCHLDPLYLVFEK